MRDNGAARIMLNCRRRDLLAAAAIDRDLTFDVRNNVSLCVALKRVPSRVEVPDRNRESRINYPAGTQNHLNISRILKYPAICLVPVAFNILK